MKSHIGPNGPSRCKAEKGNCPFGGESGEENHFNTIREAREEYDRRMSETHGVVTTLTAKHSKLSEREQKLREENAKMAKTIVALRAQNGDDLTYEDANPERAKRRLDEAVDFAASRGNTHLAAKLSAASVLPSGSFKTADGTRVNTDQVLKNKTIINRVEAEREAALAMLTKLAREGDLPVGTKASHKDANGTFTLTVGTGVDEDAVEALPANLKAKITETKDGYSIDKAREVLGRDRFNVITSQTLVTDFVMGKPKDDEVHVGSVIEPAGKTPAEKFNNAALNVAGFYGGIRAEHGSVKSIKNDLATGQSAIKDTVAARRKNTFSPARSQSNGILVSARRNFDYAKLEATLTAEEKAAIMEPTSKISKEKAKEVLTAEDFGRIFEAKKVTLRVTEK